MFDENESGLPQHRYNVHDAVKSIQDDGVTLSQALLYGLSDLSNGDVEYFLEFWKTISDEMKRSLMGHLVDVSEANFVLDYRSIGVSLLGDSDPVVRSAAIELLWEDQSITILEKLLEIAKWDEDDDVRVTAINTIGNFILRGEYGKLREEYAVMAQQTVLDLWRNLNEKMSVRSRSLEALSNSSHDSLSESIMDAYTSGDTRLVASAIYSMGRSCDEQWSSIVLKELGNDVPSIRYEAVRASGELELDEAVNALSRIARVDEREIREAAIWALGEIGGDSASRILEALGESDTDSELLDAIDDAIANARLSLDLPPDLLDFSDDTH
jgi:HEAT repeat protein